MIGGPASFYLRKVSIAISLGKAFPIKAPANAFALHLYSSNDFPDCSLRGDP